MKFNKGYQSTVILEELLLAFLKYSQYLSIKITYGGFQNDYKSIKLQLYKMINA